MKGYDDRQTDEWKQARYHGYMVYCANTERDKQKDIYEFHPLPDDPTKEERAIMKRAAAEREKEAMKKRAYEMIDRRNRLIKKKQITNG